MVNTSKNFGRSLTDQEVVIAGGLQLARLVADELHELADDLENVWAELDGTTEHILVQSEAERDAQILNVMAGRIERKITAGLKAIR